MDLRDIWNDAVWSKVIGTLIAGGILGIWTRLSGNAGFLWLRIPVWSALLMLIVGFLVSILSLSKLGRTTFTFEPKVVLGEVFVYPPDAKKTLTFPLKCHAVFRNESEGCIEVRVQSYKPGLITLQQLVFRVAGGPAFSEAFELGAPSFPVLVYGKGGVLRPRFRVGFSVARFKFAVVHMTK